MDRIRSYRLPPQVGQPSTTVSMMREVIISLIPALGMAVFFFGVRVLVLTALSVGACVLFEYGYRRFMHLENTVRDLSACVTGLLLAMSLPPLRPLLGAYSGGRLLHCPHQAVLRRSGQELYEPRPGRTDAAGHLPHSHDHLAPAPPVPAPVGHRRGVCRHPHVLPP